MKLKNFSSGMYARLEFATAVATELGEVQWDMSERNGCVLNTILSENQ